jgi:hypothetical protein
VDSGSAAGYFRLRADKGDLASMLYFREILTDGPECAADGEELSRLRAQVNAVMEEVSRGPSAALALRLSMSRGSAAPQTAGGLPRKCETRLMPSFFYATGRSSV